LVANTDINIEYFFTNLYNDVFRNKSRMGASFSRLIGKSLEVHGEALGQRGSVRVFIDPACLADQMAAATCATEQRLVSRAKLESGTVNVHALVGGRYTFSD